MPASSGVQKDPRTEEWARRQRGKGRDGKELLRLLKRALAREVRQHLLHPTAVPRPTDLRPLRNAKNISLATAAHALGTWPIRISEIERELRYDGAFSQRYRDWLNTAHRLGGRHAGRTRRDPSHTRRLDGRPVAITGGNGPKVRVWEIATGQPVGSPFSGHTEDVEAVTAAQLNGRPVAISGSADNTVRVWDLATGKPIGSPFTGHKGIGAVWAVTTAQSDHTTLWLPVIGIGLELAIGTLALLRDPRPRLAGLVGVAAFRVALLVMGLWAWAVPVLAVLTPTVLSTWRASRAAPSRSGCWAAGLTGGRTAVR